MHMVFYSEILFIRILSKGVVLYLLVMCLFVESLNGI